MEDQLYEEFKDRRKEGRACSPTWFKMKALLLIQKLYPLREVVFKGSNGWFVRFCDRMSLVIHLKTNKKQHSAAASCGRFSLSIMSVFGHKWWKAERSEVQTIQMDSSL